MDGERYTVVVCFESPNMSSTFGGMQLPPQHRSDYYVTRFDATRGDYVIDDGAGDLLHATLNRCEKLQQERAIRIEFNHMPDRAAGIRQGISEVQDYLAGAAVLEAERGRLHADRQKRARTEETEEETSV